LLLGAGVDQLGEFFNAPAKRLLAVDVLASSDDALDEFVALLGGEGDVDGVDVFAAEQVIVRHALAGVVLTAVLSSASHIARTDPNKLSIVCVTQRRNDLGPDLRGSCNSERYEKLRLTR